MLHSGFLLLQTQAFYSWPSTFPGPRMYIGVEMCSNKKQKTNFHMYGKFAFSHSNLAIAANL